MGHSAGAHIATLLALDERYLAAAGVPRLRIAGVIGLSGPYDFLPLSDADTRDMFGPPPAYVQSQPIHFVRADAPPMLLEQGEADETVKPHNAKNLAAALRAQGVAVTLRLYPTLRHADTVASLSRVARGPHNILILKTDRQSLVHRSGPMDCVIVKTYDQDGRVTGERRIDNHPRSSRDERLVCIDAPAEGQGRQLHLIDIKGLLN